MRDVSVLFVVVCRRGDEQQQRDAVRKEPALAEEIGWECRTLRATSKTNNDPWLVLVCGGDDDGRPSLILYYNSGPKLRAPKLRKYCTMG